ncbi:MAG: carboxy terminal-processing peptidase, partial [Verrucomicrobia bacterium]|nr:carboxy terminal-processing peptidase [Verrucomicrobiota bacterium]
LSLFGIGAVLTSEDGYCKITSLTPEAPASKSKKLKAGDRIVFVAQGTNPPVDVVDMKLNKVVEQIRGAKGTEVRLTIIPADAPDMSVRKEVALIRDEIKLEDQEAKAKLIEMPDAGRTLRVGYIDLPSFYADFDAKNPKERKSTTADVAKLVTKLKKEKMDGLILDLRRNGGGSLEEAINLTGLFIKEGTVVQVKDPDGGVTRDDDKDPSILYDGPLVVMTSRFSASASEILAGALQDYGRALIVGDVSTHGKGTVQSLVNLSPYLRPVEGVTNFNPGALKVTIRKFYRASGESTQLEGVKPDLVLPSINNEADVGEKALENPLPWDRVKPADFEKVNRVTPFLADLRKLSDGRVLHDKDFDYVREDILQYKKNKDEKTVSLNEAKRRKETEEAKARSEVRKKEIKSRHLPDPTVYEITLKLADKPGLPPRMVKTNTTASITGGHPSVVPNERATVTAKFRWPTNSILSASNTTFTAVDTNGPGFHFNTNDTTASTKAAKSNSDDEDADAEDAGPARDVNFEETKQILVDYIKLLLKKGALTTVSK